MKKFSISLMLMCLLFQPNCIMANSNSSSVESFKILNLNKDLVIGETYQLELDVNLKDDNYKSSDVKWSSLNNNAIVDINGLVTIIDKGDIKVTAQYLSSKDNKEFIASFSGVSLYNKDSFKLSEDTEVNLKSKDSKIIISFDEELDAYSVGKNVRICKDEEGNTAISGLELRVDGKTLVISNTEDWEDTNMYLCIDKGLKSAKGSILGKRLKYKITFNVG